MNNIKILLLLLIFSCNIKNQNLVKKKIISQNNINNPILTNIYDCTDVNINKKDLENVVTILKNNYINKTKQHTFSDETDYIELEVFDSNEIDTNLLEKEIEYFIKNSRQRYLGLLGSPGTGKTKYFKFLEDKLWKKYKTIEDIVPIFIPYYLKTKNAIIDNYLTSQGLDKYQICLLKSKANTLIMLDDFYFKKAFNPFKNENIINSKIKLLVNTRIQPIYGSHLSYIFRINDRNMAKVLYVKPFSKLQIKKYIQNTRKKSANIDQPMNLNEYIQNICEFIEKLKINCNVLNPLQLEILIKIMELENNSNSLLFNIENFIKYWVEREINRLQNKFLIDNKNTTQETIKLRKYCKNIAFNFFIHGIENIYRHRHFGELDSIWEELKKYDGIYNQGCTIKYKNNGKFGFIEHIIKSYFIYDSIMDDLIDNNLVQDSKINKKLINEETEVIDLIVEAIGTKKELKLDLTLKNYIEKSKLDKNYSIAAINAVTILNRYNNKIFRDNDILQGANLSILSTKVGKLREGPLLEGADLSFSNLRGTDLRGVCLERVIFKNTILKDALLEENSEHIKSDYYQLVSILIVTVILVFFIRYLCKLMFNTKFNIVKSDDNNIDLKEEDINNDIE
ncbi:MAG: pentapeptide repeat-containing protein [Bacteroidetes bacterium]|nr:pentapeptide repeat-containing protein [Bacteroidota bacterium]